MEAIVKQYLEKTVSWEVDLEELLARIGGRFKRKELRQNVHEYVKGLLSITERKNAWQLAEALGLNSPDKFQYLLNGARWNADAVRNDLLGYVVKHIGHSEAVLSPDETGFVKKGENSAGVQRQYSGTAGRVENCQIGVFLAYASSKGRTLIDRELYLPESWANDEKRRLAAGIPEEIEFATKPQLARYMIERAVNAQVPFKWVTGDEVYGDNPGFRTWLNDQGIYFVLALAKNQHFSPESGVKTTVEKLGEGLRPEDWHVLSAGDGAKGPRLYDWTRIRLQEWIPGEVQTPCEYWLMLRRSLADGELAYYVCRVPPGTDLQKMAQVAGTRWTVEECFEAAKGQVGLDHYEVRNWHGWYRHITLAMLAHAYLTVLCAHDIDPSLSQKKTISPTEYEELEVAARALIPLTVPEVRKLLWLLVWLRRPDDTYSIHWSLWRRRHQKVAKDCHYKRRCGKR